MEERRVRQTCPDRTAREGIHKEHPFPLLRERKKYGKKGTDLMKKK